MYPYPVTVHLFPACWLVPRAGRHTRHTPSFNSAEKEKRERMKGSFDIVEAEGGKRDCSERSLLLSTHSPASP